jgi:SAM-dependent methyltransferase
MVDQARRRLGEASNVAVRVEDGQALSFHDGSFDTVLCSLGLMFFPNPASGVGELRRVLRRGGRAALSVNTVPERSYNTRIHVMIARHVPSLAPAAARLFLLGDETRLRSLFEDVGFEDIEISTHSHRFPVESFDTYFEHIERGWGSAGAQPRPEPQPEWTPRYVERRPREPEPEPERKRAAAPGGVDMYQRIDRVWRQHENHVAQDRQHMAAISNAFDALADEAGAQTCKLQRQINELTAKLAQLKTANDEMRGEIALLRALQPKRLLSRKSVTQIEGSLIGHPAVN